MNLCFVGICTMSVLMRCKVWIVVYEAICLNLIPELGNDSLFGNQWSINLDSMPVFTS